MKRWKNLNIVYSVNVEDLQNVARDEWGRELTSEEVTAISIKLGDYMEWYEATLLAIENVIGPIPDEDEQDN